MQKHHELSGARRLTGGALLAKLAPEPTTRQFGRASGNGGFKDLITGRPECRLN